MNLIRILPEKVASQIAAGEIIERPASVARELLDNSIDAGADQIEVRIEGGGRRLIRVRDNGAGMSRDDLLLSVERHATSKIREISDLSRILSLGFRGEALPSIAAVSRLEIVARPRDEVTAHRLRIAGGKFLSMEEAGAPAGTIVEVRDLFYNLPARRKFLGGVKLEGDHVADVVTRMGLPHTGVAFRLQEGDKTVLSYGALEDPRARLGQVLGRKTAAELLEIREEQAGVGVHAFLAPPEFSRSRGDRLLFFVNRRNVRDRMMARAVMEGFGQRLMRGRYPQAAVFLSLDPSAVDVNVHPTKQEVRFQDGRRVFRLLSAAIDKALRPAVPSPSRRDPVAVPAPVQERLQVAEPSWGYESETRATQPWPRPAAGGPEVRSRKILGQLGRTYILCEDEAGLLMVDQHAAHERVVYEALRRNWGGSPIESQGFLVPQTVEVGAREKGVLLEKGAQLLRLGIEVEHFGGNTFLLRSVPALMTHADWPVFLADLVVRLAEGDLAQEAVLDGALSVMACHGALRAGQRLSPQEMEQLLQQLEKAELGTHCPHGRPVTQRFSFREIEKRFKRVT